MVGGTANQIHFWFEFEFPLCKCKSAFFFKRSKDSRLHIGHIVPYRCIVCAILEYISYYGIFKWNWIDLLPGSRPLKLSRAWRPVIKIYDIRQIDFSPYFVQLFASQRISSLIIVQSFILRHEFDFIWSSQHRKSSVGFLYGSWLMAGWSYHIQALKTLRTAEFKPYVIFVRPRIGDGQRKQFGSSSSLSVGVTVSVPSPNLPDMCNTLSGLINWWWNINKVYRGLVQITVILQLFVLLRKESYQKADWRSVN